MVIGDDPGARVWLAMMYAEALLGLKSWELMGRTGAAATGLGVT